MSSLYQALDLEAIVYFRDAISSLGLCSGNPSPLSARTGWLLPWHRAKAVWTGRQPATMWALCRDIWSSPVSLCHLNTGPLDQTDLNALFLKVYVVYYIWHNSVLLFLFVSVDYHFGEPISFHHGVFLLWHAGAIQASHQVFWWHHQRWTKAGKFHLVFLCVLGVIVYY